MTQPRVLFVSHGGGPLPLLGDAAHQDMIDRLPQLAATIGQPAAIIVISAHWECDRVAITAGAAPSLIYDYYGFPPESYQLTYPCPGAPALAKQVYECLQNAQIESSLDDQRGFDHGLFVPLKLMYPAADIPCIQLSLVNHLDPAQHLLIGQCLQALELDHVLIMGSGFSFHNLREFFAPATPESDQKNAEFEDWLGQTLSDPALSERDRAQRLIHWETASSARFCHPRAEHLMPLHVCYGLTQRQCSAHIQLRILNKQASMFLW